MSEPTQATVPPPAPRPYPTVAALLSLAVPGLGQMFQGLISRHKSRFLKGAMFLVIIWGMFFLGYWLSGWKNVWLPHKQEDMRASNDPQINRFWFTRAEMPDLLGNLCQRWQYLAQFWNGVVAWPTLWNYYVPGIPILKEYQPSPGAIVAGQNANDAIERRKQLREFEEEQNKYEYASNRFWDIGWIYTMISGMLNLLVIYDAAANPVPPERKEPKDKDASKGAAK